VKTATWDVIAWNRAAMAVLTDYGALAPAERNILRMMFSSSHVRTRQTDWDSAARFVVATFRADAVRAGATESVKALVDELSRTSPEFAAMWADNNVRAYGEGTKRLRHPAVGVIEMEFSAFAVDGRADLGMVVYNPATPADREKVRRLVADLPSGTAGNGAA
jgi:hypothetical protein